MPPQISPAAKRPVPKRASHWPGVGLLFINAIQFVDIPVMAAYLMLISVMFVGINLVVDLLYVALDPRIRRPSER